MSSREGFLLSLEGIDGSGKTTAVKSVALWMKKDLGIVPVVVEEPGGTLIGKRIADLIKSEDMLPLTEALLFQASRAELVRRVIKPALKEGRVVVADRFSDSSKVYQGQVRGLNDIVMYLNKITTDDVVPDLTFLMCINPEIALQRKKREGHLDRIELKDLEFFTEVEKAYVRNAGEELERGSKRWVGINAEMPPQEVAAAIQKAIYQKLQERGFIEKEVKRKER